MARRRDTDLERAIAKQLGTSHPELRYFERLELARAQLDLRPAKTEYLESVRLELEREYARTIEYAEDELEDWAEEYGISIEEAAAFREHLDVDYANPHSGAFDYERLRDYLDDLADALHQEVEDLWELWRFIYYGEQEATRGGA